LLGLSPCLPAKSSRWFLEGRLLGFLSLPSQLLEMSVLAGSVRKFLSLHYHWNSKLRAPSLMFYYVRFILVSSHTRLRWTSHSSWIQQLHHPLHLATLPCAGSELHRRGGSYRGDRAPPPRGPRAEFPVKKKKARKFVKKCTETKSGGKEKSPI
jgi:hypothetical protein